MLNVRHVTLHVALLILLALFLLVAPLPIPAALAAEPTPTPGAQLPELLRRADQARRAGRWSEAAQAYRAALELAPTPVLLGELGAAEEALGQHRDAAEHLYAALRKREELSADQARRFAEAQRRAERRVGVLAISANPPEALVLVDGRPIGSGRVAHLVFVEPGPHTVRAVRAGHADVEVSFEIAAGASRPVPLYLRKLPATAPPTRPSIPRVTKAPSEPAGVPTLTIVGLGVAGGVALVSGGLLVASEIVRGDARETADSLGRSACYGANASRSECEELHGIKGTHDAVFSAGVIGLAASLGTAAAALSSIWWAPRRASRGEEPTPRRPAADAVRVRPAVGAGWGAILVVGRW